MLESTVHLSFKEAADNAGLSRWDFLREVKEQQIPTNIEDGRIYFSSEDITTYFPPAVESPIPTIEPEETEEVTSPHEEVSPVSSHYDYPNKNQWRDSWNTFLQRNVSIDEKTNILFLGGFGEEIPHYQSMGIPLENMVVIERNAERANHIQNNFYGVQVINTELINFLENTCTEFDAILLDYDGQLTLKKADEINIATRRLKSSSVFGINVMGAREPTEMQDLLFDSFILENSSMWAQKFGLYDIVPRSVVNNESIIALRNFGMTSLILRSLLGTDSYSLNSGICSDISPESQRKFNPKSPNAALYATQNFKLIEHTAKLLQQKGISPEIALAKAYFHSQPFIVTELCRDAYKSEQGNNIFYSDFVALQKNASSEISEQVNQNIPSRFGVARRFVYGRAKLNNLVLSYERMSRKDKRKMNSAIRRLGGEIVNFYKTLFIDEETKTRGLVDKIRSRLPLETRDAILTQLYIEGRDERDILAQFPEATKSMSGIKANYTKGIYTDRLRELRK